jgi:EmrB/QacA subfamily drug resistance transporter
MAARPGPGRSPDGTGTGGPAGLAFASPQGRWTLLATVLGSGIAFLDSTVVTVALPRIGADLDAGVSGLQWVLNGYLASLSALILLGGSLGDRLGRRRVFVAGVLVFTVASVACALAPTIPVLVVGRAAQGVGGALLTPGSLAILEASFRPDDRARAIGAWSGLTGIAAAVGPFLGGWLVDAASWRWIFLINVPVAAVVVAVAVRHVPETLDRGAAGRLDVAGALVAAAALGALSWGMIAAGDRGWGAPAVLGSLAVGAGGLAAFAVVEARSRWPMMPLGIFRVRQFTAANLVTLAVYAALGGVFFLLVVHLQEALGYSALEAGAASLPITVLMLALSSRSGALAHRIGPRLQMSAGPIVLAAGVLLLARVEPGDGYATAVLPAVVVVGLGLAATVAPLTATALGALEDRHAGLASGVNTTVARAAQLVAVAALPALAGLGGDAYTDAGAVAEGFRRAMLITAGLAFAGGVVGALLVRNPERAPVPAPDEAPPGPVAVTHAEDTFCGIDGTPLRACPHGGREEAPVGRAAVGPGPPGRGRRPA